MSSFCLFVGLSFFMRRIASWSPIRHARRKYTLWSSSNLIFKVYFKRSSRKDSWYPLPILLLFLPLFSFLWLFFFNFLILLLILTCSLWTYTIIWFLLPPILFVFRRCWWLQFLACRLWQRFYSYIWWLWSLSELLLCLSHLVLIKFKTNLRANVLRQHGVVRI